MYFHYGVCLMDTYVQAPPELRGDVFPGFIPVKCYLLSSLRLQKVFRLVRRNRVCLSYLGSPSSILLINTVFIFSLLKPRGLKRLSPPTHLSVSAYINQVISYEASEKLRHRSEGWGGFVYIADSARSHRLRSLP